MRTFGAPRMIEKPLACGVDSSDSNSWLREPVNAAFGGLHVAQIAPDSGILSVFGIDSIETFDTIEKNAENMLFSKKFEGFFNSHLSSTAGPCYQ